MAPALTLRLGPLGRLARLLAFAVTVSLVLFAPAARAQETTEAAAQETDVRPGPPAIVPLPEEPGAPVEKLGPVQTGDVDRDGVPWRPLREYRFGTADYIITGAAVGGIVTGALITPSGKKWQGGILFDEDARDALRFRSLRGRYWVRDMSDVGVSFASTWPFLVDALVTAWWYRGRADLALNMALVGAQAFAIASMLQSLGNIVGVRERPFGRLCGKDIPLESVDCQDDVRYRSFFSGHATLAFTSASVVCANHIGIGLFGKTGDVVTCASGYGIATLTTLFRVMSDMHYASDAIIGALVGTAAGLAVPILHFKPASNAPPAAGKVDVRLGTVGPGLGLVGTF